MRIVGGRLRGLKLAELGPGDPAAQLRPTSDRVREAIFNLLVNGGYGDVLTGARVLDLFAGTGALGLEALSRGAARVAFVDDGAAARALLRRNIELARAQGVSDVWRRDATALGPNRGPGYGLVFLDPPYGRALGERAVESALAGGWLAPGALVVWEEGAPPVLPPGLVTLDQRRYGDTVVTLARTPEAPARVDAAPLRDDVPGLFFRATQGDPWTARPFPAAWRRTGTTCRRRCWPASNAEGCTGTGTTCSTAPATTRMT